MDSVKSDGLFSLKLSGDGVTIDREVSEQVAHKILNLLFGGNLQFGSALEKEVRREENSIDVGSIKDRKISLREFIDDAEAKRNPDKIVCIGEYIVECEGEDDFSGKEVKSRFRQSGDVTPKNFGRDFRWAVSAGWIAEDTDKAGRFYVTNKGREAIKGKFSKEIRGSTVVQRTQRRRLRRISTDEGTETTE